MKKIIITIVMLFLLTTQVMAQATYNENRDDFTGKDNSAIIIEPSSGDPIVLGWKCFDDGLNMLLAHSYLGGGTYGHVDVKYKFDDEEPVPIYESFLSKNHLATFLDADVVRTFTQKSLPSHQVMIRINDPLDGKTLTSTFKLAGLSEALPKLECVDSLDPYQ